MDKLTGIEIERPNIIWVFGDQHRAQAMGCNGDPNVHTPNLDRFAAEGMNFTSAVAGFPLCCPFRGSLLSSRYPHKCVPSHEYRMDPKTPTIAHTFTDAGYDTAYFGKWHLDGFHEARDGEVDRHVVPPERRGGFGTWAGYENNNAQWDTYVSGGEGENAFQKRLPGFETDALTDMLIDYIKSRTEGENEYKGKPFFAVLSVQPPHDPYIAPEEWMRNHTPGTVQLRPNVPKVKRVEEQARRELAGYYAQIENLDWNFGRVREALEKAGLSKSTHIVFFADHGDMHGSHGQFRKTAPWEESVRIPFIIGGGALRRNRPYLCGNTDYTINHVDIAPTTLGLCGIEKPEWMEGTDYSGLRRRDRPQPDEERSDSAYLQCVIPTMHGDSVDRPWRGIVTRDGWKYVVLEGQPWLMFNLNEDPYEEINLAHNTKFKDKREELQKRLEKWINETGDSFDMP